MPIVGGKYVSPIWSNDSGTKINASEMQAITDTIEKNQNEKADKVTGAAEGNLAALDGTGNLVDSGVPANPAGSWLLPEVTITTVGNATVTAVKDDITREYTVGPDGVLVISLPEFGTWTLTATEGAETKTETLVIDAVKQYTVDLPLGKIYGVEWGRVSSPVWARTDDAALFADPVPFVNNGMTAEDCSSPFDGIMPWAGMVRSADAAAGELVAIPKFYYKWTNTAEKMKLQISDKAQRGFHCSPAHMDRGDGKGERSVVYIGRYHCSAGNYKSETGVRPKASIERAAARNAIHNLGADIWQLDHAMWWTINMLYLVEFANANCQGTIGYGRGNGSSTENMGYTDTMPYHTGTMKTSKTEYGCSTQYRNIEGLWDNVVDWCDGIYFSGANIYHIIDPAMFSDNANGTLTGTRATVDTKVITGFTFPAIEGFEWAGYPGSADVGASSTTGADYFCDNEYYNANGVVLNVGGSYNQSQLSGLFYRNGYYAASGAVALIGARLQKLP